MSSLVAYTTITGYAMAQIEAKKSRFIGEAFPCATQEQAAALTEDARKRYRDARHHCYAYVIGAGQTLSRAVDDGEPAQTAGKPILDVITGAGLSCVLVVVSRYFGGTLLGTGGLIRAYSAAAKAALKAAVTVEMIPGYRLTAQFGYPLLGKISHLLSEDGLKAADTLYGESITLRIPVPSGDVTGLESRLTQAANGAITLSRSEELYL